MASPEQKTITVDGLMAAAFDRPRDPRSAAYKAGVRAHLARVIENKTIAVPYPSGTAERDAFYAGETEGQAIYRQAWEKAQLA